MPRKAAILPSGDRTASVKRETGETQVSVEVNLDGTGRYEISLGNGMMKHMLSQLSRHGLIDLKVVASGDTHVGWHHVVEDIGIVLGKALRQAVGDARGIVRMGHSYAPLDEALALTVVDFSGRGYAVVDADIGEDDMGELAPDLIRHFLESMAREAGMALHVRLLAGTNNHHKAEVIFKSLGRAMRMALSKDP
ncbi:MAG: imidazoleglycerol-phosphate dehydratase HisB, partial [SAR202 cluster bacterium]|nr:imidazoleglycerol-phosphate dehydratase HisB [SAR202 cluster bacterium]